MKSKKVKTKELPQKIELEKDTKILILRNIQNKNKLKMLFDRMSPPELYSVKDFLLNHAVEHSSELVGKTIDKNALIEKINSKSYKEKIKKQLDAILKSFERRKKRRKAVQRSIELLLASVNTEYDFVAAVLLDSDGMPLAVSSDFKDYSTVTTSVALENMVSRIREYFEMSKIGDLIFVDELKLSVISQAFDSVGEKLILYFIGPPNPDAEKAMKKAVSAVKRIMIGK
jgi:hypothetical protein